MILSQNIFILNGVGAKQNKPSAYMKLKVDVAERLNWTGCGEVETRKCKAN